MSVYEKLKERNIPLTPPAYPAAAFVPFAVTERTIYVSGHIARRDGKPWVGRLGDEMTTAEGQQAARSVAIDLLGTLEAATGGHLDRIRRIAKLLVLVH